MTGSCIPYTELPGVSRLAADFVHAFPKVGSFYGYDPWDPTSVHRRLDKLSFSAQRRSRLVEALRQQNGACEALVRLSRPDGVAVLAGQQVGLFTGPVFTFYKALTAVRVAERLVQQGIPAAAVFWLASEDHDYDEVNQCWVFDAGGAPLHLSGGPRPPSIRGPVGDMPVPGDVVARFRSATQGLPHAGSVAELLDRCYPPDTGFAAGFGRLLRELVGRDELLIFDPLHGSARELLEEPLAAAADRLHVLAAALASRNAELFKSGYHAQVGAERGASLLFVLAGNDRLPVRCAENRLTMGGTPIEPAALVARAKHLSAGALLRPVVQDWLFPTAVSVVGPSEIAYLAQASALYECLDVGTPVWRLRASCTVVDARAGRLFERYGLRLQDFFAGEQAFREVLAARLIPPETLSAIERCRGEISTILERMAGVLAKAAGPLPRSFHRSRRRIEYQLSKIARTVAREALRRDETAARHARWLYDQIYPHRKLQERVYSIVAFLARHGLGLVGRLRETVLPDCPGHQLVRI